jgi:hypothetical protein
LRTTAGYTVPADQKTDEDELPRKSSYEMPYTSTELLKGEKEFARARRH